MAGGRGEKKGMRLVRRGKAEWARRARAEG